MKKNVTLILSLISSIIISQTCLVKAQHYSGQLAKNINKDASELIVHHLRNNISFIRVDENKIIAPAEAVSWLKQDVLKARAEDNLLSYQKNTDNIGFTHDRYRQYYKG